MATRYKHRRSNTTGAVPTSLEEGELALNIYDGKLFYGKAGGTVGEIATGSADLTNYARTDQAETFEGYVSIEFDPTQGNLALLAPDTTGLPDGITAIGSLDFKTHDGATALAGMYALTNMTAGEQGTPVLTLYSQGDIDFSVPNGSIVSVGGSEVLTVDSSLDYLKLNVTGTRDGTKFLRDDGAWALPAGNMSTSTYDTNNSGVVDDSEKLGGVAAANYARTDQAETFNEPITVKFDETLQTNMVLLSQPDTGLSQGTFINGFDFKDSTNSTFLGGIYQAVAAQAGKYDTFLYGAHDVILQPSAPGGTVHFETQDLQAGTERWSFSHLGLTFGAASVIDTNGKAEDANKLGGVAAADYALKSELGGSSVTTRTVTASATILSTDQYVFASAASGNVVLTLPSAATATRPIIVKRDDLTTNTMRLLPVNGQTVDGDADAYLNIRTSVELVPVSGNWRGV